MIMKIQIATLLSVHSQMPSLAVRTTRSRSHLWRFGRKCSLYIFCARGSKPHVEACSHAEAKDGSSEKEIDKVIMGSGGGRAYHGIADDCERLF